MSKDITKFENLKLILAFLEHCENAGYKVIITSVDRDYKEQYAYFLQGREPLHIVNEARKRAGLSPITQAENQHKITWTLNSEHVVNLEDQLKDNDKARAFDFAVLKSNSKEIDWKNIDAFLTCAYIGESLGLYSGGRFKNKDYPHLQIKHILGKLPDVPIGNAL